MHKKKKRYISMFIFRYNNLPETYITYFKGKKKKPEMTGQKKQN